jgi:multiple sugar transport system substrate-binding protein
MARARRGLARRSFLAGAATVAGLGGIGGAGAQQRQTLRFWTSQGAPAQMQVWRDIFQRFEQANPQYTVATELYSDDNIWPKLTAGYAARDLPDLVSYVQAYTVATLDDSGLVEPFDDVIRAVGADDFYPSMRDIYRSPRGYYMAATLNNQTSSNLWYRKDLLAEAGLQPPRYWDELLAAARRLTRGDVYGNALPYGRSAMTATMMVMFVHQAGGTVVAPDMSVSFNSPETVAALEFLKELFQFAPPGATSYSWGETLNAFVTGRAAMAPYTGRPIVTVATQNPPLLDKISRVAYPHRREGRAEYDCPYNSLFIPKGARNVEGAKLLARALFEPQSYMQFLLTAPGHNLPSLRSAAASPELYANPLMQRFRPEVEGMIETTNLSRNLVKESDRHPLNKRAGEIFNSLILAEVLQNVVAENIAPRQAAARGADRIAEILRG